MNQDNEKEYYDEFVSTEELMEYLGMPLDDETDTPHTGNGYAGISMSNNALAAYAEGRKPLSKWSKRDLIQQIDANREIIKCDYDLLTKQPVNVLKKLLLFSDGEYHHTGLRYNETLFYHFDNKRLSNLTDEKIKQTAANVKTQTKEKQAAKKQEKADNEQYNGRWEAIFTKRSADGRFKRDITMTGEVKNGWFFPDPGSEYENKRKIGSKCLYLVKRI